MYLLINSQKESQEILSLYNDQGKVDFMEMEVDVGFSEQLLIKIDELLKKNNLSLTDLKVIAINTVNNTFSSLRTAVATTNIIGYCFKMPVVSFKAGNALNFDTEIVEFFQKKCGQPFEVLFPQYDHEPNITQAKKIN